MASVPAPPPPPRTRRPSAPNAVTLNKGADDELLCKGYRRHICKQVLFYLLTVFTLGIPLLVLYWKPQWKVKLMKTQCPLNKADTVLLMDLYGNLSVCCIVVKSFPDGPYTGTSSILRKAPSEFTYVASDDEDSAHSADDTTRLTDTRGSHCIKLKYFEHCYVRYVWDQSARAFQRLRGLDGNVTCQLIHDKFHGLFAEEQAQKLNVYGENSIHVEVKSYFRLFIEEVLNPFYIFQICSVILWSLDEYVIYASCIVFISLISLGVSLYETRKQSECLRDMVGTTETTLTVIRGNGEEEEVATGCLVPGDVLLIPARGCMMMCDAVLVSGNAIVNESMLTGESVPVTKTPLAPSEAEEVYQPDNHKRHTLFCGTQVIQTRYYGDAKVRAVVVRTGFSTAKGELVRSILFPKPVGFKFYQDAMKFTLILACIAAIGMSYSIFILVREGTIAGKVLLRALDIITIVVPPALPAAMTVGTVYAQSRLKKQNIFCISPPRINVCGKLKCICFDKTGTLTEDGLDMWGVIPLQDNKFDGVCRNPTELAPERHATIAMATCHSLTVIDNELVGDPLDLKMFNSVNWILEEPGKDTAKYDSLVPTVVKPITRETYYVGAEEETPFEVGIVRQFTFSSGLQRMSVITRVLGADHMDIYTKGAPEKIASLCTKETLPADFADVLHRYTMKGYRVIALAYKPLDSKITWQKVQRIARDVVETDLEFLGLLIMENQLKPQTTPVIHQLNVAKIRTVMVTGDNMLTAISVARQCGMVPPEDSMILVNISPPESGKNARITWEKSEMPKVEEGEEEIQLSIQHQQEDNVHYTTTNEPQSTHVSLEQDGKYHFAITGKSFGLLRLHFPNLIEKIIVRGTIFARMSPDQKAQLVEYLIALGYGVGMCGDGANDCGALKAAHAGISLSEAEASVASPFTSKTPNIECVPTVIREGRAALVTSFGVFKYMALYSIIQFVSVLILYSMGCNLGDWMFLYIDLIIITSLVVFMGHTAAYPQLVAKRPPGSLVSPLNVFSILLHILLVIGFQAGAYVYLLTQPWYIPATPNPEANNTNSMEGAVIFYVSCFQYLMMAFIFSKGKPYRQPIWTNVPFLVLLLFLLTFTSFILMYPLPLIAKFLELSQLDLHLWQFRLTLMGMAAINFLLAFILETYIASSGIFSRCVNAMRRKKGPRNRYKIIEQQLVDSPDWPPIGEVTMATRNGNITVTTVQMSNGQ